MDVAGTAIPFGAGCTTTSGLGQMMKAAGKGPGQMLLIRDPLVYFVSQNLCKATERRSGEEKMNTGLCYSVHGSVGWFRLRGRFGCF